MISFFKSSHIRSRRKLSSRSNGLIKDGKLQPGEKLPPERTLASLLGVGRSSVREAVNMLETLGFLEIRNRKGTFVRSVSSAIISDPLEQILKEDKSKLLDLYELRKDIEIASAYLAAQRRTDADLATMKTFLDKMEAEAHNSRLPLDDDMEFHLAIARATGSFLRVHILRSIFDLCGEYIEFVQETLDPRDKQYTLTVFKQHQSVFQAIHKSNHEDARAMMDEHLTWVAISWQEAFTKDE